MRYILAVTMLLAPLVASGCSQTIYESLRERERQQCLDGPESTHSECLSHLQSDYRDYLKQREQQVEK